VRESLNAAGIKVRRVQPAEIPFQLDQLLCQSETAGKDGNWAQAGLMLEDIAGRYGNELWIKYRAAEAYFKAGEFDKACELVRRINDKKPTVDSLLLDAKLKRREKDFRRAIVQLEEAERILEGKELVWI